MASIAELQTIRARLAKIHHAIHQFRPPTTNPPILDSSIEASRESTEDAPWLQQEPIPGLKKLKDSIEMDLDMLNEFLKNPKAGQLPTPTLSTNAPYLVAVWNEILCAPPPVVSILRSFPSALSANGVVPKRKVGQKSQGTKVDVVADDGKRWIRVNTIKNARLLAEFREIDSYFTDSDDELDDQTGRPSLAQKEFDNSILQMGRALLEAAKANPIEGTSEIPNITMRLTRLNPNPDDKQLYDPRIDQTMQHLRDMGIEVELGDRGEIEPPPSMIRPAQDIPPPVLYPTPKINLDLSVLIALVSDLTHAPLPRTIEEAKKRFIPPESYREWKQKRLAQTGKKPKPSNQLQPPSSSTPSSSSSDIGEMPSDLVQHSRALTNQIVQEMSRGLIDELRTRLSIHSQFASPVEFWTTIEARDRCLRIISKIGGPNEKRRAHALFYETSTLFACEQKEEQEKLGLSGAEEMYWKGSRFEKGFLPLFPLRFYSTSAAIAPEVSFRPGEGIEPSPATGESAPFFEALGKTCKWILSQELIPNPKALPEEVVNPSSLGGIDAPGDIPESVSSSSASSSDSTSSSTLAPSTSSLSSTSTLTSTASGSSPAYITASGEIQRAIVTKVNPKLTAHTVQSLLYGAELGWTTLTANRSSVKAILKEMRVAARVVGFGNGNGNGAGLVGGGDEEEGGGDGQGGGELRREERAVIWVVDPRSLAEGMSSFAME